NNNYEDDDDDVALEDGNVEKGEWDWERWKMHFVRVDELEKIVSILQVCEASLALSIALHYLTSDYLFPHFIRYPTSGSSVYELYAISNHYGGLSGGHYSAYAKGFWYRVFGGVEKTNLQALTDSRLNFFRKFWAVFGSDFCTAVEWFFEHASFPVGCNSSFVALIPKSLEPKSVGDYRPISLIGSIYKVVTKILATRLSSVISDLVSDVQTPFLPNRQILDGPFIINELLARCHHKNQRAMLFKVDFAKAYDSIRWDYLETVLSSFGFGVTWRSWIRGSLHSSMASILVNGSPSSEFQFHRGLKQGDPLALYLFILIMESLHLSFSRVIEVGAFTGIKIDASFTLSHLFYADDAVFIGDWSQSNLISIMQVLRCFSLISGVMVGGNISLIKPWDVIVDKLKSRLTKWKLKTLFIGGRLTLLKSILGSTPIYYMSLYKTTKSVLNAIEAIRRNFFNGYQERKRKITWTKWTKVLASKANGGMGVSSFYALNRGLLVKWLWRFLSHGKSLRARFIKAAHGPNMQISTSVYPSLWSSIVKELNVLKYQGFDFVSHCKIKVGNRRNTSFWKDLWIGDSCLSLAFPCLYALENNKDCTILELVDLVVLTNSEDRWVWDLNGDGIFRVKDVRSKLDDALLPKGDSPTCWIKSIPIKVNIFAWKVSMNCLPTRINLARRGVLVSPISCSICHAGLEDLDHLLFECSMATDLSRAI
nr:RNA-directed DNA polymerase, eukaryota, reverse transcriptase zinc-binding domain protein [Tanacetum cinerariifolium]